MVHARLPAESADVSVLGQPLHFVHANRTAKNRFLKAALTERTHTWHPTDLHQRGIPTQRVINLFDKWGHGGFGMILTGNWNLEAAGNAIISKETDTPAHREAFAKYAKTAKADGALAIVQLSHAGRQTPITVHPTPWAPSEVQLKAVRRGAGFGVPKALTIEQIKTEVIDRFVFAAKFSKDAGFDGVEIHGAHGYLLSQFMSPTTNKRTDQYGGDAENRIRVVLEIFEAIRLVEIKCYKALRKEIPASTGFVVGIKINSAEFQEGGLQTNDTKVMCSLLEKVGFDFVEMSGGNIEKIGFLHQRESTKAREAFFLDFSDQVRPVFKNTRVYVTGGFRTAKAMANAVKNGNTDGVGLGRPITAEPDLPKKILSGAALSAPDTKVNPQDYSTTNIVSNTQMWQAGGTTFDEADGNVLKGIADLSIEEEAEEYLKQVKDYNQRMIETSQAGKPIHGVFEYKPLYDK